MIRPPPQRNKSLDETTRSREPTAVTPSIEKNLNYTAIIAYVDPRRCATKGFF